MEVRCYLKDLKKRIEVLEKTLHVKEKEEESWWPEASESLSKEQKNLIKESNNIWSSAQKRAKEWMSKPDNVKRESPFYNNVIHSRFIETDVAYNLMTKKEKNTTEQIARLWITLKNKYDPSRSIRSSIH